MGPRSLHTAQEGDVICLSARLRSPSQPWARGRQHCVVGVAWLREWLVHSSSLQDKTDNAEWCTAFGSEVNPPSSSIHLRVIGWCLSRRHIVFTSSHSSTKVTVEAKSVIKMVLNAHKYTGNVNIESEIQEEVVLRSQRLNDVITHHYWIHDTNPKLLDSLLTWCLSRYLQRTGLSNSLTCPGLSQASISIDDEFEKRTSSITFGLEY